MPHAPNLARPLARRAALAGLAAALAEPAARATPMNPAASLWSGMELQDSEGRTFGLRANDGRARLIHMWANWCPACLTEMGSLAEAAPGLERAGAELVLVSHPDFWAADLALARRRNLRVRLATPTAANPTGAVGAAMLEGNGAYVVPRTLLLGAAGRDVVWSHMGPVEWSAPSTAARVRAALNS